MQKLISSINCYEGYNERSEAWEINNITELLDNKKRLSISI